MVVTFGELVSRPNWTINWLSMGSKSPINHKERRHRVLYIIYMYHIFTAPHQMFYKRCLCNVSHQLIFFRTPLVHLEGRSEENESLCISVTLSELLTSSWPSFGSSAKRTSQYMMGLIFLQVFDQIWALLTLRVRMKRPIATLLLRLRVLLSGSRDLITENTIMINCSKATDIITKCMAVAWIFLFILLLL